MIGDEDLERSERAVKASVSPYHCVLDSERQLKETGFEELGLGGAWKIVVGGNYYVKVSDSSLVTFTVGENLAEVPSLRIATSHTDWPCLKLKPPPEVNTNQYDKLNIEVYEEAIYSTWLDRPLSTAGKVCVAGESPFEPVMKYVDMKRPLVIVLNLAIHMNREVNEGVKLNAQVDILPVLTMLMEDLGKDNYFLNLLAKRTECLPEEVLDCDIYLYNLDDCTTLGLHEDFFSAPKLDNITSVQACLIGTLKGKRNPGVNIIALYDNEKVGSRTKQDTLSSVVERVLKKLYLSLGYTREEFLNGLLSGFSLPMGVAHALHPNHVGKYDIESQILLRNDMVIKMAAGQSYAADAAAISAVKGICRACEIPYKKFSNRSDIRSDSILGTLSSSLLSVKTADVGASMLAMHSARELIGSKDQATLMVLCTNFFQVS